MSEVDAEIRTIRSAVALHRPGFAQVAVRGPAAYEVVDAVSTRDLFVRTGQILHSLILAEDGTVEADLYVCPEAGGLLLLADGVEGGVLIEMLQRHAPAGEVTYEDRSATHSLVALEGPYAWEMATVIGGPELVTLGYMQRSAVYSREGVTCFRIGTTGEYGYVLQVPLALVEGLSAEVAAVGVRFDLREVSPTALERCALENGFYCPRHRGVRGLNPLELQLQWRVTHDRVYRGSAALQESRARDDWRRVAWVLGRLEDPAPALGGAVRRGEREVGVLLAGHRSPILECFVGLALLDRGLAHPWIDGFFTADGLELRTEAPPLLHNRSLFVDPRKHIYAAREADAFPPLVPA